jgi:S1-C subfamily serine protease
MKFSRLCVASAAALLLTLESVFLSGCATGTITDVKQVEAAKPIAVGPQEKTRPISVSGVLERTRNGAEIGTVYVGMFMRPVNKVFWKGGRYLNITDEDINDLLRKELSDAHYDVVGGPDRLFKDDADSRAEFSLGGIVDDIKANVQYPDEYNVNYSRAQVYLKVKWEVYSSFERKVVLTEVTEGSVQQMNAQFNGLDVAFDDAFRMATQNLLARKSFHDLAASPRPTNITEGKSITLRFKDPVSGGNMVDKLPDLKMSVVTIFNGNAMGSGFVVTENGYILTDCHVVGDARYVRIQFASGMETDAEVICKNRARDVALVKCGEQGLKPLSVRRELPKIGEEVYAIGTPLKEYLTQTVTKGIVSGYRQNTNGQLFIQSDVNTTHGNSGGPLLDSSGNVLGLCDRGLTATSDGHNFFNPIDDTIKALKLDGKQGTGEVTPPVPALR